GGAAARGLGLAPEALGHGVVGGGLSGGMSSAVSLGSQALVTSALQAHFASPRGRAIWNQGMPSGKEWAIAIPAGAGLGVTGGAAAVRARNTGLIGTVVETPGGPMRIGSVDWRGNILLQPLASTKPPPPPPPITDIPVVYDPASGTWSMPS